ncbi:hypothetical protein AAFF_G00300530 [Aldrovandia affinis]|uniref:Uncharacterized protein n=1 Tax=Aldrovandia affinis TaxID=143900 RepID=A0AAD7SPG5_9TELE|nr:hypothetical protein AAFF_G00300530 [Aldrovandia affinis]
MRPRCHRGDLCWNIEKILRMMLFCQRGALEFEEQTACRFSLAEEVSLRPSNSPAVHVTFVCTSSPQALFCRKSYRSQKCVSGKSILRFHRTN